MFLSSFTIINFAFLSAYLHIYLGGMEFRIKFPIIFIIHNAKISSFGILFAIDVESCLSTIS